MAPEAARILTSRAICGKISGKGGERMTDAELQFFMGHEAALPIYAALREAVFSRWPDTELRAAKTQLTFKARYGFAFVSTRRMGRGCPEVFIIVSFGLGRELRHPRIFAASEPIPGAGRITASSPRRRRSTASSWPGWTRRAPSRSQSDSQPMEVR